jgi:single-strand DNA-binding protein
MSLNKVILIGNVGKDPDVRYFDSGSAIANFSVATSERGYTLANGTVVPERTEWHNIVVRRDQVQFVEKWVKKGSSVYVEGKIRTRNYDDQTGVKRYITEIHADRVEFYSTPRREDSTTQTGVAEANSTQPTPTQPAEPFQQPAQNFQQPSAFVAPPSEPSAPIDDLPF